MDALRRNSRRGRIDVVGEAALHGLFFNSHVSRMTKPSPVYVVRQFAPIVFLP